MSDPQRLKRMQSSYNVMSGVYDRRYEINPLNSLAAALLDLIMEIRARSVLEVGCGTGHWLKSLFTHVDRIIGLDVSIGMLNQGIPFPGPIGRVCGSADSLPFYRSPFDLIFAVNAIHHFDDKRDFIESARLLLRPAGAMAIVSMDMDSAVGHSVIYNYFPGALEYDRSRFPMEPYPF